MKFYYRGIIEGSMEDKAYCGSMGVDHGRTGRGDKSPQNLEQGGGGCPPRFCDVAKF